MIKEKLIVIQENSLQPPQNPVITIQDNDVHLSWDAIGSRRIHQSKDRNLYYLIYISRFPDKQFAYLHYTSSDFTNYVHEDILDLEDKAFYQIIGFEGTLRDLERFISSQTRYRPMKNKKTARKSRK